LPVSTITLESSNGDSVVVSAPNDDYLADEIILDTDPKGMYDVGFTVQTQSGAFEIGGRPVNEDVPIREPILPFWLTPESRKRFQNLWGTPGNLQKVKCTWDGPSGPRWLILRLAKQISYTTEDGLDAAIDGVIHAVVSAHAYNPMYEAAEVVQSWPNFSADQPNEGWFSVWNPTDQQMWLEWEFEPAQHWWFPDFSFGQERKWGRPVGADAARMIQTPQLTQLLSVMVDPLMDTYVSADLSNAAGLFNGVEPVYAVPPYTGTEDNPVMMPVICDGPVNATAYLRQRRFWSAESGLEA
jgi:hypothetical protein